jgi:hypothetical protein
MGALRPLDRVALFAAVAISALMAASSAPLTAADACLPGDQLPCACEGAAPSDNPTVRSCFLGDVNRQSFVQTDSYSANVFAALSWPLGGANGVPDRQAELRGDYATVWESWKSTRDIFQRNGEPPIAWESRERALPLSCRDLDVAAEKARFAGADKVPDTLTPRLLDEYINPEGDPLIDASGQPVRYEVLMNREAYDYVADNRLWDIGALDAFLVANGKLSFPEGAWNRGSAEQGVSQTRGAIVAKAAWKLLDPARDDFDAFHKTWAYVTPIIENGAMAHGCQIRPVGLVGLHLALKLRLFPDWLWASFEHRAVAPTWAQVGPSTLVTTQSHLPDWLFYSFAQKGGPRLNKPPKDAVSGIPTRIVRAYPSGYYYPPVSPGRTPDCETSMEFECFNHRLAEGLKDSVMSNYQMIGAQWRTPENQGGLITPEVLGNATLESFSQTTSSCIGCHSHAKAKDSQAEPGTFDFIFSFGRDVLERGAPSQIDADETTN